MAELSEFETWLNPSVTNDDISVFLSAKIVLLIVLFDLILYVPSTIFQLYRDGSSWV